MDTMDQQDELAVLSSEHGFRLVRRGYDPAEVQAFAAAVVDELEALRRQNADLDRQVRTLEAQQHQLQSRPAPAAPVVDEATVASFLGEESLRVMAAVRQTAEDIKARAESAAAGVVQQARDDAAATVQQANEVAARTRNESETYAERVRNEADMNANRIREDADAAANAHRAEALAYVEATRQGADREVAKRRAEADVEATQLVADARQQRAAILNDLAARRERALADVERLIASRRLLLDALDRVRTHSEDAFNALAVVDGDGIEQTTRAVQNDRDLFDS